MRPVKERFAMVYPTEELSVTRQCQVLNIHRSGLYYKPKGETKDNLEIMKLLDEAVL